MASTPGDAADPRGAEQQAYYKAQLDEVLHDLRKVRAQLKEVEDLQTACKDDPSRLKELEGVRKELQARKTQLLGLQTMLIPLAASRGAAAGGAPQQLRRLEVMLGRLLLKQVDTYVNLTSTGTNSSTEEIGFRKELGGYYGFPDIENKTVSQLCMVTGALCDWHDVVAGHIIPRKAADDARSDVRIDDINNPRNGLLWCRALEAAWSRGLFCFAYAAADTFKFKLLDNAYFNKRVQDFPVGSKQLKQSTKAALGQLTWGHLHTSAVITFQPGIAGRPYRRALSLMAKVMLVVADDRWERGAWEQPEDVDPDDREFDYGSEGSNTENTVAWIQAARDAAAAEYAAE